MAIVAPDVRTSGPETDEYRNGFSELWHYRDLLFTLTLHRIRVRYKQSILGLGWAVAQPLAQMLILTVVFSHFMRIPSEGLPYSVFVFCSLLPWQFFAGAIQTGSTCLVSHSDMIRKVGFPREVLPLSYVIAGLFDFAITVLVLVAMMIWYRLPFFWTIAWTLPLMVVATLLATAATMGLSALQARFRDVSYIVPLMLQLGIYSVPVLYPLSTVPERWRSIYQWNPLVPVVDGFRSVWLKGAPPDLALLGQSAAITVALFFFCYLYFRRVETTMADYL